MLEVIDFGTQTVDSLGWLRPSHPEGVPRTMGAKTATNMVYSIVLVLYRILDAACASPTFQIVESNAIKMPHRGSSARETLYRLSPYDMPNILSTS